MLLGQSGAGRTTEQLLFYYGFAETDPSLRVDVASGTVLNCERSDASSPSLLLVDIFQQITAFSIILRQQSQAPSRHIPHTRFQIFLPFPKHFARSLI